jgi:hypothetical protein
MPVRSDKGDDNGMIHDDKGLCPKEHALFLDWEDSVVK